MTGAARDGDGGTAERVRGTAEAPRAAAEHVRSWLEREVPRVAVVLGSGLGGLADRIEDGRGIAYADIPGWPAPGVVGHSGRLLAGRLGGVPVLGLAGRSHLYEGHDPALVALPVRALGHLGVEVLLLSNAAGAVNRHFAPGELMLVTDHVNLTFRNPLVGPVPEGEGRWPDLHRCYDPGLREAIRTTARERGVLLREGVYAAMLGPSFETPAEIRMLRRLGVDAVGMSTVPEVLAARARGIRCAAVSCLTNYAAGVVAGTLDHEEVLETTERAAERFQDLIVESVRRIAAEEGW